MADNVSIPSEEPVTLKRKPGRPRKYIQDPLPEPAAKRPRGRPRKSITEPEEEVASHETPTVEEELVWKPSPVVKKGPGRPRKVPIDIGPDEFSDDDDSLLGADAPPVEKRPRGRPRKNPIDSEPKAKKALGRPRKHVDDEVQPLKRPIGRPRKSDVVSVSNPPKRRGRPPKNRGVTGDVTTADPTGFPIPSPDSVLGSNEQLQRITSTTAPDNDSLDGYQSAHESLPNYEELRAEVDELKQELASIKQHQKTQEELDEDVIYTLRQELAELREVVMLSSADASRAILNIEKPQAAPVTEAADANGSSATPTAKRSGALSTAARKVLRGIAHHEFIDPEAVDGEVEGALIGDVADFTGMPLEDVMAATEELALFGLIEKTKEENAWALNDNARKVMRT